MILRNEENPNLLINTNMVCDYWRGELKNNDKPFAIQFTYPSTGGSELVVYWYFKDKENRDIAWDTLMCKLGVVVI